MVKKKPRKVKPAWILDKKNKEPPSGWNLRSPLFDRADLWTPISWFQTDEDPREKSWADCPSDQRVTWFSNPEMMSSSLNLINLNVQKNNRIRKSVNTNTTFVANNNVGEIESLFIRLHYQRLSSGKMKLTRIGRFSQREQLPENDAVGPHVRLCGEDAVYDRFEGHPLDRQRTLNQSRLVNLAK